jgi:hypothetical protein
MGHRKIVARPMAKLKEGNTVEPPAAGNEQRFVLNFGTFPGAMVLKGFEHALKVGKIPMFNPHRY